MINVLKRWVEMMQANANSEYIALNPEVVVTPLEDGALLLHLENKYFFSLNLPAWAIIQILECGATHEIVTTQCKLWGANESDVEGINNFINQLLENDLAGISESALPLVDIQIEGGWSVPTIDKHNEPLEKIVTSAFDPSVPLAE